MDTRTYEIDLMSADKSATSYKFSKDHVVVGHSNQDCDIAIFDQAVLARHLCICMHLIHHRKLPCLGNIADNPPSMLMLVDV